MIPPATPASQLHACSLLPLHTPPLILYFSFQFFACLLPLLCFLQFVSTCSFLPPFTTTYCCIVGETAHTCAVRTYTTVPATYFYAPATFYTFVPLFTWFHRTWLPYTHTCLPIYIHIHTHNYHSFPAHRYHHMHYILPYTKLVYYTGLHFHCSACWTFCLPPPPPPFA